MPSTAIVDVAIGIAFVYLFFSLICSVVNEAIASIFSLRAKNLVDGIHSLFSQTNAPSGKPFVQELYQHGLIRGLFKDPPNNQLPDPLAEAKKRTGVSLPSYIPTQTFVTALLDVIAPSDGKNSRTLQDVRNAVGALPDGTPAKEALTSLLADTQADIIQFQEKLGTWFNNSMSRAAGWYKRKSQRILLVLGLVVAVGMNVDTIKVATTLWNNPSAREATVALAQQYVATHKEQLKTGDATQDAAVLQKQAAELMNLGKQIPLPFGWGTAQYNAFCSHFSSVCKPTDTSSATPDTLAVTPLLVFTKLVGWLITALALSLGAPFWFDTLNKFMAVRTAIKPKPADANA